MSFTLTPVSACPDCGAPIYGPEAVSEEYADKIKIVFTCHCNHSQGNVTDEVDDG